MEPRNFAVFLTWAYTHPGNIINKEGFAEAPPATMNAEEKAKWFLGQWNRLAKCWALGDFLQAPYFQNHIADLMVSNFEKPQEEDDKMLIAATPTSITTIWNTTRTDSSPRRITLDILMSQITPKNMRIMLEQKEVPEDFVVDMCECGLKTSRRGYTSSPTIVSSCKYHIYTTTLCQRRFSARVTGIRDNYTEDCEGSRRSQGKHREEWDEVHDIVVN
jgi:hypothetical protein